MTESALISTNADENMHENNENSSSKRNYNNDLNKKKETDSILLQEFESIWYVHSKIYTGMKMTQP